MDEASEIILPIVITVGGVIAYFCKDAINQLFSFKFRENEIKIILTILESKYQKLKNDLNDLAFNLIKDKKILEKVIGKIRESLASKNENLEKIMSEPKKIFILGETGVGKSTLINCIEGKQLAPEAKASAPTTMEYKEYISNKNNNYVFCDTKGIEMEKYAKIEKYNIKQILENSKGLNSYIFWYLKGSSSNFQDFDAKYLNSIKKALNREINLFFVVTKSVDEDKEKVVLDKAIKEYFPCSSNFPIFPLLARGSKRNASFGLDELMNETKNFFKKEILDEIFKDIYKDEDEFNAFILKSLNESTIKNLFKLILNHIRLEDSKNLDNQEIALVERFILEKYNTFVNSNIREIKELCCLIKAKYEIIDINQFEATSERLTNINNSLINISEENIKEEVLQGCTDEEKKKIESKVNNYLSKEDIELAVKNLLKIFLVSMFRYELDNQVKNILLTRNILFD